MSGSTRIRLTNALIALALLGSACGNGDDEAELVAERPDEATPPATQSDDVAPVAEPTIIQRLEPTATPTIDPQAEPFHPVVSDELAGVPVPIGAEMVEFFPASEVGDARADYSMPGVDDDEIGAWFIEWMPEHGWDDGDERDGGGLVFLHTEEISDRYASEGLKRTATVILDTLNDNIDFSLLVEAAAE